MKKGRAVSTTVAAVVVIVIVAAAGGSYYYYAQISTTPQKTIGVVFDIGGRGDLSFNDMAGLGAGKPGRGGLWPPERPRPFAKLFHRGTPGGHLSHISHCRAFELTPRP